MKIVSSSSLAAKEYYYSDYIPIISTITNLFEIFQKIIVLPRLTRTSIDNSHRYTYSEQKGFLRCSLLLFPILGDLIIGFYDLSDRYNNRTFTINTVKKCGIQLKHANERLKADKEVVLTAVRNNGLALEFASEGLRADKEVVLAAVKNNGLALEYACECLKANRKVVLAVVKSNGLAIGYAEHFRDDREIALIALNGNKLAYIFVSDRLMHTDTEVLSLAAEVCTDQKIFSPANKNMVESILRKVKK